MKPPKKLDAEGLMNFAGRTLARRARSLNEVRARLRQRAERPEDVEQVISRLKQAGLLDDRQFADSFARGQKENRSFGKARVMRDLMARRVAPAVAKQAAESTYADADEVELIEKFLERKYRGRDLAGLLAEENKLAAVYRRLRTAGFSASNSLRVLNRYNRRADELEGTD
ncbi:MAG TPA: RecX family transcriptional regulator [Bryobacteraceae bacterium]